MTDLPPELALEVCSLLDTTSLKQARLVSKFWSQHATTELFSEVYVILVQESLWKLLT